MKIERIELNNFGSYEDLNFFDVMTDDQSKRIIVIGGKMVRERLPFLQPYRFVCTGMHLLALKLQGNDI